MTGGLFFVSILGFALIFMLLVPRLKAGAALLCSLCFMLFVSFYGCIMAEVMVPTAYALMYGGLGCAVLGVIAAALDLRGLRRRALSPSLLIYAAFAALTVYIARNTLIGDHDALSYWARVVKELFVFDRFHIHADSTMFHMDYIPMAAALQYSIVRVFGWHDAYLTYVCAACIITSIAALCDLAPKGWMTPVMAVLLFYAYRLFGFGLLDLRGDSPMVIVFAAAMLTLLARTDDSPASFLPALCSCAVLTGFKIYSGLMFAVIAAIGMLTESISLSKRKLPCRAAFVMTILAFVLILCLQFGWSVKYNAAMSMAQTGAAASAEQLFSGNPRTAQLMNSFTDEKIAQFLDLSGQTFVLYGQSQLVWMWLFVLAALVLAFVSGRQSRSIALKTFILMTIAAIIYLLGLFASYFVQAETFGAATTYLVTASTPLMIAAVFFAFRFASGRLRVWGVGTACAMAAGMIALLPPAALLPSDEPSVYENYSAMAVDFYTQELEGQLTAEDAEKHALLIDCSFAASEIKSQSGKSHAYAYFALPIRVEEPIYYRYGDYTQLEEGIDGEAILNLLKNRNCELLILRIEDELYWEEIAYALDLYGDYDGPIGVYDVEWEDNAAIFTFRGGEEAYEE